MSYKFTEHKGILDLNGNPIITEITLEEDELEDQHLNAILGEFIKKYNGMPLIVKQRFTNLILRQDEAL